MNHKDDLMSSIVSNSAWNIEVTFEFPWLWMDQISKASPNNNNVPYRLFIEKDKEKENSGETSWESPLWRVGKI